MKLNKLFLVAALSAASTLAHAASLSWDGGDLVTAGAQGGTGNWNTNSTANWWNGSSDVVWPALGGTDDDAVFGGTAGTVTIATATANDLTFNTTGYNLTGGTLTLNGTTPTITTASGVTATITSTLAGTVGFTKTGAGTLTLTNGGKTLTGPITVNQGILEFNPVGSANVFSTNPAVTLGGGTIKLTGASSVTNTNTLTGVTLNAGSSSVVAFKGGSSTVSFQVGAITRNVGGTVQFTQTTAATSSGFSAENIVVGNITGNAGNNNDAGGIIGGYAITNDSVGAITWAVKGTSAANTIKAFADGTGLGSYTTDLTGTTANVNLAAGAVAATGTTANTLRFNAAGTTLTLASGATVLTDGGILVTSAVGNTATTITGGTSLAGAAGKDLIVHQLNAANTLTIASNIVNNGGATGLTKSGAGALILSGANTYTGNTYVNAGTLSLSGSAMVASGTSGVTIASGATLAVSGTLKLVSNTSQIANSGTFDLSSGTDVLDLNGQITGLSNGSTYNLFSTAGTITGNFNTITGYDTVNFSAAFNASNGVITFTAVPEPSTYGLIGAGALAGVAFVRRRRRHAGKVAA